MKPVLAMILIALGFAVVGELDYRDEVSREASAREYRNWIAQNCIPQQPNQRGVIEVRHDGSTQCAKYENAGYGRAPRLVFAEVRDPN